MMNTLLRLEFEHVFPDEVEKDVIEYLKNISAFTLLNIIGFSNTYPQPNFDNFASNLDIRKDIVDRVNKYSHENNIEEKPRLVSREGSLRLAEIILSNRKELIEENKNGLLIEDCENIEHIQKIILRAITNKSLLKNGIDYNTEYIKNKLNRSMIKSQVLNLYISLKN